MRVLTALLAVGDGTTSVVVLAGELLREAEKLIEMKIHPQTIIRGIVIPLFHACLQCLIAPV